MYDTNQGRRDRKSGESGDMVGHRGRMDAFEAGLIAFGAALNISVGYLVAAIKLPLYLDSIGTVLVAALCGWQYGVLVGLSSLLILTLTTTPTVLAYAGTTIAIAVLADVLTRIGFMRRIFATILGGLLIGAASALVSVPVTTFLYGGVSLAGADAVTTLFKASGMPIWKSVLFGGLITDPADKLATALICLFLARSLPPTLLRRFAGAEHRLGKRSVSSTP